MIKRLLIVIFLPLITILFVISYILEFIITGDVEKTEEFMENLFKPY